jgi:hypothetical protein
MTVFGVLAKTPDFGQNGGFAQNPQKPPKTPKSSKWPKMAVFGVFKMGEKKSKK